MSKTLKMILIGGGIILVIVFILSYMSSGSDSSSKLVSSSNGGLVKSSNPSTTDGATAFLSTLLSLNKINIDSKFFNSQTFTKLQDNTEQISNNGTVGRANPFAPLDGGTTVDNSTAFPQINTGAGAKTAPAN